jgi:hypothetical protein
LFLLEKLLPTSSEQSDFDDDTKKLSPAFIKIYDQAVAAEAHDHDEIAGPEYRKALEFLVKDYAILLNPNNKTEIRTKPLASVISEFFSGDKLPLVSICAAWLGNDETHYERRWVGKDPEDLKQLIGATVHFMAYERLAANLPIDMPDSKKSPAPP